VKSHSASKIITKGSSRPGRSDYYRHTETGDTQVPDDDDDISQEMEVSGFDSWNRENFLSSGAPVSRIVRLTKAIAMAIYFIFLVFGMVLIAVGGFATGTGISDLLPKHFPAVGLFGIGLVLIFMSGLGFISCLKQNKKMLYLSAGLLILLVGTQIGLSIEALHMGGQQWDNELYQSWMSSSLQIREKVEKNFDCCGFKSEQDEIPSDWNFPCASTPTPSDDCCKIDQKIYKAPGTNSTCRAEETRLECCGPPDPCVGQGLGTCSGRIGQFITDKLVAIGSSAFVFALVEVIAILLTAALAFMLPGERRFIVV